jgi:predicted transcriptional regulator of viral defense system
MKFTDLLQLVGNHPVFVSTLLRAGDVDPVDIASQLSRWVARGKLVRLRREVYAIAAPYRRRDPHAFEIANVLVRPSYVSLEAALAFHGLIPEAVFTVTSITTARPQAHDTPLGAFAYRHVSPGLFWGYVEQPLAADRTVTALVARPEKALLDLVYLRPAADEDAFLRELRLDRLDLLDLRLLTSYAERSGKPKLARAAARISVATHEASGWEDL